MEEIKIYFSCKNSDEIVEIEMNLLNQLFFDYFKKLLKKNDDRKTIYLLTFKKQGEFDTGLEEIEITHCIHVIIDLLGDLLVWEGYDIFLQEYDSFEDAYKVALDMREPSELCYSAPLL
jgi:hypothetical protein